MKNNMNSFDLDGVISLGIHPGPNDIIITGRSIEEKTETIAFLKSKGINNVIYFNPLPFNDKTRKSSGKYKADTINELLNEGYDIEFHFDDDLIQIEQINKYCSSTKSIHINHNGLIEMENIRRDKDNNEINKRSSR